MTDLDRLKFMLDSLEIEYEDHVFDPEEYHSAHVVTVRGGVGHEWLVHDFRFDEDGKYKNHGLFE